MSQELYEFTELLEHILQDNADVTSTMCGALAEVG